VCLYFTFGIIIVIPIVVIWYRKRNKDILSLPLELQWYFDSNRIQQTYKVYDKDGEETKYYYTEVNSGMKEHEFFNELKKKLNFSNLEVKQLFFIFSPLLLRNFVNRRSVQILRMKTDPHTFYSQSWTSNDDDGRRKATMDYFFEKVNVWEWNNNLSVENGQILPVVHGTGANIAWKIAQGGFAALSKIDAGFYGKGIYFSSHALYTLPYVVSAKEPAILICLIIPGNPFPVIVGPQEPNSFLGAPISNGYQSHYVITNIAGNPWKKENGKQFDEIVVPMEEQILPMFLVLLEKSALVDALQEFQREIPKMDTFSVQ